MENKELIEPEIDIGWFEQFSMACPKCGKDLTNKRIYVYHKCSSKKLENKGKE